MGPKQQTELARAVGLVIDGETAAAAVAATEISEAISPGSALIGNSSRALRGGGFLRKHTDLEESFMQIVSKEKKAEQDGRDVSTVRSRLRLALGAAADGREVVRAEETADESEAVALGTRVAERVLREGGRAILDALAESGALAADTDG